MKFKLIPLFSLLLGYLISNAQFHIRYNQLGYSPFSSKRIVILSEESLKHTPWNIKNKNGSTLISGSLDSSICGSGLHTPFSFNYEIDFSSLSSVGNYTFTFIDSTVAFKIDTNLFSFIPNEILHFLKAQRSGTKDCFDHKISHKGDKRCLIHRRKSNKNTDWGYLDYIPKYADMRGGWYDAGDYIKFTLTTAYTSYLLLTAYQENPELFQIKNYSQTNLNDLLDEAAWGLDYLLKTYQDTSEFIIQVGGHKDHQQGDRLPEFDELNGQREAYSAFSPTQMGYTTAALALGSHIFLDVDSAKSSLYREMAIKLYSKARNLNDCYWVKQGWEEFYADKTPYDNLLLAATELYHLTQEKSYLEDMYFFSDKAGQGYWVSWGNSNLMAHTKSEISDFQTKDLEYFKGITEENNNIWNLPHKYTWSSLYSFLGVGNGILLNNLKEEDSNFEQLATQLLDYSLGMNNWGMAFICSDSIPNCACNTYSQIYKLQPKLTPIGAVAEGPGDRTTHEQLKRLFQIPKNYPLEQFNSAGAVFYNLESNFQTMESTIVGEAEALLFFALYDKFEKTK